MCCRTDEFRAAPKGKRLQRFGRPVVAASTHTHMSVADSGVTRVRRPSVAASIHICIEGCMQASKFYQGFADQLHCERTHVGCRMNHLRIAPKDQGLQRFRRPIAAATMCVAK